ncbi:MAG: carbohydrate kinase family protein [Candidatus Hydrothermarchaeaceae archaeon]
MDVVGIGALNYDHLYKVDNIAGGGYEERVHSVVEAPGGSSANTIVGLSRLGCPTGFIGMAGSDREGNFILDDLKKEGVDSKFVGRAKGPTGKIIGFVDRKGERALYAHPGVNDSLKIEKNHVEYAQRARFMHVSPFVGEESQKAQKSLLNKLSGPSISFSPGMLYSKKFNKVKPVIKRSFVIFLNGDEMRLLTGKDYLDGAADLLGIGSQIVAVTLGSKGCYVAEEKSSHHIKAYSTKAVDTTGAGDAFSAGFLYGLLKDKKIETCAKIGNFAASKCIARAGARDGLPYLRDLKKLTI